MKTPAQTISRFLSASCIGAVVLTLAPITNAQYCVNPQTYCTAKMTSQGQLPQIGSVGMPEIVTNQFFVTLSQAPAHKSAIVITGATAQAMPFFGGTLCVASPFSRSQVLTTDSSGSLTYQVPLDVSLNGAKRHFQVWFRDAAHPDGTGVGLSNALSTYFAFIHAAQFPPAPSVLVHQMIDADTVQLNWSDNANNETKYRVAQLDPGEDPNIAMDWDNVGGDLSPNTVSFQVDGLLPGQTYQFKVRCGNDCGYSDYSNITYVTPGCPTLTAPSNLMFSQYCSEQIRLDWTDNSSTELTFRIARLDPGENPGDPQAWDHVGTVGANVTTFTDTSVEDGLVYQYKVRAYDGCGYSVYSDAVSAWTICVPVAPWNCTATRQGPASPPADSVLVEWDHNGVCVAGFRIARLSPGRDPNVDANWDHVGLVPGNQFFWLDTPEDLIQGALYHYRVRAQLDTNCGPYYSAYSNMDSAHP